MIQNVEFEKHQMPSSYSRLCILHPKFVWIKESDRQLFSCMKMNKRIHDFPFWKFQTSDLDAWILNQQLAFNLLIIAN